MSAMCHWWFRSSTRGGIGWDHRWTCVQILPEQYRASLGLFRSYGIDLDLDSDDGFIIGVLDKMNS